MLLSDELRAISETAQQEAERKAEAWAKQWFHDIEDKLRAAAATGAFFLRLEMDRTFTAEQAIALREVAQEHGLRFQDHPNTTFNIVIFAW